MKIDTSVENGDAGMITKKERTREAILSAAYELFAREGFNKITMKDICEATGMSRGGLYSHFGSTREVFEAILQKISQSDGMNFLKEMEAGESAVDILERALSLMRDEMEHAEDSLSLAVYEYACTCSNDMMEQFNEAGKQKWSELIEYGISRDEFNVVEIDEIVNIVLYAYQGIRMWSRIVRMSPSVFESIINHIRKQLVKE